MSAPHASLSNNEFKIMVFSTKLDNEEENRPQNALFQRDFFSSNALKNGKNILVAAFKRLKRTF